MLNSNQSARFHFKTFLVFVTSSYCVVEMADTPSTLRTTGPALINVERTTYIYIYVIARVGVKFGINFTSVRLSGNKIARGEAECYLPLNLTRVKFVMEISRLTVLLKINTIASLLFI